MAGRVDIAALKHDAVERGILCRQMFLTSRAKAQNASIGRFIWWR